MPDRAFIRFAFREDWDNPELYDLVLNIDHLTIDLAVDTILHLSGSEEGEVTLGIDALLL